MSKKYLFNARVITVTGETFEHGSILIDGDKIAAVGNVKDPGDAERIDLGGCIVTPGLVEAHSHIGLRTDGYPMEMRDYNEMTSPCTPYVRAIDAIHPNDPALIDAMEGGVSTLQLLPGSANVIGGQGAIVKSRPDTVDRMVVKFPTAMKGALGENPVRVYGTKGKLPCTRMGSAFVMRDAFTKAQNYRAKKQAAEKKGDAFDIDLGMEALVETLERRLTFRCHAHRLDDIQTAVRVAEEFGLDFTIEHCTEGHFIAQWLKEHHVRAAVGPTLMTRPKLEMKNLTWDTPRTLCAAGVHFCITTDAVGGVQGSLALCASLAVRAGLPYDEALKAVTIYAAEHIGYADRVGSLEPGKDADIAVWDGDPLVATSSVVKLYINGEAAMEK